MPIEFQFIEMYDYKGDMHFWSFLIILKFIELDEHKR